MKFEHCSKVDMMETTLFVKSELGVLVVPYLEVGCFNCSIPRTSWKVLPILHIEVKGGNIFGWDGALGAYWERDCCT